MSTHTFTKFPVALSRLNLEVQGTLGKVPNDLFCKNAEVADNLRIGFAEDLTQQEITTLTGVVAAHTGEPLPDFRYCASSHMCGYANVTETSEWQEIGGTVTTITAFVENPANGWGRMTMQVKTTGAGAQLNVVRQSDGVPCMSTPYSLPDTNGAWACVSCWINQNQPSGIEAFVLNARLNGAMACEVRWVSISLLEKVA